MKIEIVAILNSVCAIAAAMAASYNGRARAKGWPMGTIFARPSAILLIPLASAFFTSNFIIPIALFRWWTVPIFLFGGALIGVLLTDILRNSTQILSLLLCTILPPVLWFAWFRITHS